MNFILIPMKSQYPSHIGQLPQLGTFQPSEPMVLP